MKKIILIASVLFVSVSFGASKKKTYSRPYGMAGCGWGSILMGNKGNQVLAATTNDTSGSQTFGISSGTANCVDDASSEVAHRSDIYINANRYALESDIARGNGETLSGLTKILGCKSDGQIGNQIGSSLQQNYGDIFTKGAVVNEITDSIITVIQNDEQLASKCPLS